MRAIASPFSAAALLMSCCGMALVGAVHSASAEDKYNGVNDVDLTYQQLARQVANTSIIWVDSNYRQIHKERSIGQIAETFGKAMDEFRKSSKNIKLEPMHATAVYEGLGGFAIPLSPAEAQRALDQMRTTSFDKDTGNSLSVSPDMIVSIMDATDCLDRDAREIDTTTLPPNTTPIGVKRVGGGGADMSATAQHKVWIIDTGLDNASKFIHVDADNAANCTVTIAAAGALAGSTICQPSNEHKFTRDLADRIGHGTMLAGIIAATPSSASAPGLVGVAPGVTVVPLKIFDRNPDINLSGPPLAALDYVAQRATAGDIVNISWGAAWLEGMDRDRTNIETMLGPLGHKTGLIARLQKLVTDQNLKLVVAAGNVDSTIRPSWVQLVMPAGAGSYPKPNMGCGICTVSAVESSQDSNGQWTDTFWFDQPATLQQSPHFGSNYGRNPPDFAEPGVAVLSIWPKKNDRANRVNSCSGTSFAAAYLSGVLARGEVAADYNVTGDPDSPTDKKGADPVGVLAKPQQAQ